MKKKTTTTTTTITTTTTKQQSEKQLPPPPSAKWLCQKRKTKQSNQLSLPHQDDCKTRRDTKQRTTKHIRIHRTIQCE